MQASSSSVCECAEDVAVGISLHSRLSSAADDLCLRRKIIKKKEWEKFDGGGGSGGDDVVGGEVMIKPIFDPIQCPNFVIFS